MNITITIPDDCVDKVEKYCQKYLHMTFQAKIQQGADIIVENIRIQRAVQKGVRKNLDKFFDGFGDIIIEETIEEEG